MAANYSQYTDHNEIGGVSVGLEDAKLAAADTVDEVASTDCVLMKDASGNPVKILKEDFNEAVRDALGSILANSELGASIGRVAALGSSDNDLGSISTSDLASVLGVTDALAGAYPGTALDLNDLSIFGTATTQTRNVLFLSWRGPASGEPCTVTNTPTGEDSSIGSVVYIAGARLGYGVNIFQLLVCPLSRKAYYRIRTGLNGLGWSEWKEL